MELRQLRYFVAVAEEANLTRAAERLGLRSPSLSQQARGLERELGAALFDRTAAGMELTPARGRAAAGGAGGVILADGTDRARIEEITAEDPFLRTGRVRYEIIAIEPTRSALAGITVRAGRAARPAS
ncbi:helix-turn-helix domain-containing protein [Actinomadura opuntiae]|uniref:helix-turn-helix domain-containing protein n=1 Tax=Actinomadura sp. OS1-43 TaxID=604315 RepID=UPI00255AB8A6|nr:LysR family transcriptional regulator [Actinomadura sp. OS1-43]MDL4819282.1 LysR family transcriptional regulator [Actinomadura sp. OS1-43]